MIKIAENQIIAVPWSKLSHNAVEEIIMPLKGEMKREWFSKHAYFCLPLTIGNQYGFAIRSLKTVTVFWNGGDRPDDVEVIILEDEEPRPELDYPDFKYQSIESHFGIGTVTIQNSFTLRTSPGVNLMTINPPNYWIDGIHYMTGVIETDNLRRDFTFNLKITRPGKKILIKKGDLIGCVIPVPRYFVDSHKVISAYDLFTEEELKDDQDIATEFGVARREDSKKSSGVGRLYTRGVDVRGCPYADHQRTMLKKDAL